MKKLILLILVMSYCLIMHAQGTGAQTEKNSNRYHIGGSYSFMVVDMKLSDLSLHSVWYGEDLGTKDLTAEEIDTINSYSERSNTINNINVEVGMSFLDKPGSKWKINGMLMLGIAQSVSEVYNTGSETQEYKFNSELSKPCLGLGLNVGYQLNRTWGLSLRSFFMGTMGNAAQITDNINLNPENFSESREDKYKTFYERMSLMADFTAGNITLAAGPGFYWINSNHKLTINRTNTINGDVLLDEINSSMVAKSFIDGSIAVEWRVIEPLSIYVFSGIGNDLVINTGIHYNF